MHVCVCLFALINHLPYIIVSGRSFGIITHALNLRRMQYLRTESACIEKHKQLALYTNINAWLLITRVGSENCKLME